MTMSLHSAIRSGSRAFRLSLLAGVGATALSLAISATGAQAQVNTTGGTTATVGTNLNVTGPASLKVGTGATQTTLSNNGNAAIGNNLTVNNTLNAVNTDFNNLNVQQGGTVNGGLSVNGGLTTDNGTVNNNLTVGNTLSAVNTDFNNLTVQQGATFNTAGGPNSVMISGATGLVSVNGGGLNVTGGTTTDTLHVTNGATIDNGLTVTSGGANITGDSSVNGSFTVNGGPTTLNGGATVNGNTQLNGNLAVSGQTTVNNFAVNSGSNVDFGGNVLHNVAAPVLGTDAANKAYVDAGLSAANKRIDKADQGVAIALSIQNPVLTGADRFGVSVNWSDFQGNSAVGASAVGIISYNYFGAGEKIGLTGGFGVSDNQVAGRMGVQFTW